MRKIILVQHCQSEHHINNMSGGWTDTPLTEFGRKQANSVGNRLCSIINNDDYILYASDLMRAHQTAEIIGQHLGLDIRIEPGFREINTGVAAGKTKAWAQEHQKPRQGHGFDMDYQEYEEGETYRQFFDRVSDCMQRIWNRTNKNLLVVTHGGTVAHIMAWWLYFDANMASKAYSHASPGSISILQENQYQQHVVRVFNDTSHLVLSNQ